MFLALKKMGAEVCVRLPDRIEEGYGISKKAIKEQAECGAKLFVTVDAQTQRSYGNIIAPTVHRTLSEPEV